MNKTVGVFSVILENNKVLLVKRKDLPLWDLPGGRLESNESFIDCAVREAEEETGYKIEVVKNIGYYFNKHLNDEEIIFISKIVSGKVLKNGPETRTVKFFPIDSLPINLIPNRKKQILKSKSPDVSENQHYIINENNILRLFRKIFNRFHP